MVSTSKWNMSNSGLWLDDQRLGTSGRMNYCLLSASRSTLTLSDLPSNAWSQGNVEYLLASCPHVETGDSCGSAYVGARVRLICPYIFFKGVKSRYPDPRKSTLWFQVILYLIKRALGCIYTFTSMSNNHLEMWSPMPLSYA